MGTEHHLIVTHEVINVGNDRGQLARMSKQAKEGLEVDKLQAVADRGYFDGEEILACEEAGVAVTLPKPMTSNAKAEGRFGKQDFAYLPDEDVYRCPSGERLPLSLHQHRARNDAAPLLVDGGMPKLRDQEPMYAVQGAPDHALGARACGRGGPIPIPTPCGRDVRQSSIPSVRSRPVWVRPTS